MHCCRGLSGSYRYGGQEGGEGGVDLGVQACKLDLQVGGGCRTFWAACGMKC